MSQRQEVTEGLWEEWKQNPCTKRLMEWAGEERQELMESWASGTFTAAFDVEMAVKNAGATGACSIYQFVRELDFNQIVIGAKDVTPQEIAEQVRT